MRTGGEWNCSNEERRSVDVRFEGSQSTYEEHSVEKQFGSESISIRWFELL